MSVRESAQRVVAIDGPAASGKSSVARALAKQIGFDYVNSGAMYRAVTWHVLNHGVPPGDAPAIVRLLEETRIDCTLDGHVSRILIDGVDPTPHLCEDRVNQEVSLVSSVPRLREILVAKLRGCARDHDIVMEGRDIGSVVFPETPYKFYIDASPEVRLRRRAAQGQRDQIAARDRADSSRRASPLIIAEDAHVIDSSNLTIEGVVGEIVGRLKIKGMEIDLPL
ncbi:MAG TPA: (d)CMP kinase [Chthoniobacterales bacterium]|nr:(d)CMP kinase [Chthoniobacterales bacterium]